MDDTSQVLRQVRAALEREPRVDLHHYPLNIDLGADGALMVEGEVADIAAKKLALEAAAAVPGVAAVIDRLRVAPATRMTDGEIRDHIRDALFEEPAFENCGISIGRGGVAQMVRQRNSLGFIEASSDEHRHQGARIDARLFQYERDRLPDHRASSGRRLRLLARSRLRTAATAVPVPVARLLPAAWKRNSDNVVDP